MLLYSPNTIKSTADHIVTPSMRMTFNPTSLRSVTSNGYSGSYNVSSRVYSSHDSVNQAIKTRPEKDSIIIFDIFINKVNHIQIQHYKNCNIE